MRRGYANTHPDSGPEVSFLRRTGITGIEGAVAISAAVFQAEARPSASTGLWADLRFYRTKRLYNFYGYPVRVTVLTAVVGNWAVGYRPWPPFDQEARDALADFACQPY
jgi:hypothetical protein